MAPAKPARVARIRARLTCSLSSRAEPKVANSGEVISRAIPCQMGTGYASAQSQSWMPITASNTRNRCNRN